MAIKKNTSASRHAPPSRKVGRRAKSADGQTLSVTRNAVIACASEIAREIPIDEITIALVAGKLGIVPGMVRYLVGTREDLVSELINAAFKQRFESLPELTGDWRRDLEGVARASLKMYEEWQGLATQVTMRQTPKFVHPIATSDADYGLSYFDHACRIFKAGGFTAKEAAMAHHLMMNFIVSVGLNSVRRQSPVLHHEYIVDAVARADPKTVPGARFAVGPFSRIDTKSTFNAGLEVLFDGFANWLERREQARRAS